MLEDLLRAAGEGGAHSVQELGRRLSISLPLLETMLEDLARRGYLRPLAAGCGGRCSGCAMGGCTIAAPGRLWVLTEKGSRAAAVL